MNPAAFAVRIHNKRAAPPQSLKKQAIARSADSRQRFERKLHKIRIRPYSHSSFN